MTTSLQYDSRCIVCLKLFCDRAPRISIGAGSSGGGQRGFSGGEGNRRSGYDQASGGAGMGGFYRGHDRTRGGGGGDPRQRGGGGSNGFQIRGGGCGRLFQTSVAEIRQQGRSSGGGRGVRGTGSGGGRGRGGGVTGGW